jgi:hypothetical protein
MRYVKWTVIFILVAGFGTFLHYNLPQRDIVQIVGTDTKRIDDGADPTTGAPLTRDVRFINARTDGGATRVYRNEDTRFGWPPYFKYDSGDITAEAQNLAGTGTWVAATHYGWRIRFLDMFPNVVKIRVVDGPDDTRFPWFNTIFLIALGLIILMIWRWWNRFHERRIEPVLEDIGDGVNIVMPIV